MWLFEEIKWVLTLVLGLMLMRVGWNAVVGDGVDADDVRERMREIDDLLCFACLLAIEF